MIPILLCKRPSPKGLTLEKFKAQTKMRVLESSFISPTSDTYLQIGHEEELKTFLKLLQTID